MLGVKPKVVLEVRDLRKADLARLAEPRRAPIVAKLRDSHHHLAKLFASGLRASDVADRVGMSASRVAAIRRSPAFDQLVAEYRDILTEKWAEGVDDYFILAAGNMVRAELQIADRLAEAEEAGETLPVRDLLAISRDAADRFGYGKHTTQTNVNVDFAAQLERAIRRSRPELKVVESAPLAPKAPLSTDTEQPAGLHPPPRAEAATPGRARAGAVGLSPPSPTAPFQRRRA